MLFVNDTAATEIYTFPYTTLFRSPDVNHAEQPVVKQQHRDRHHLGDRLQLSERTHRDAFRSEEHTSELQSLRHLVCRLLLEKKKITFTLNTKNPLLSKPHTTRPTQ